MLVLSRTVNEEIQISIGGRTCFVKVLKFNGTNQVRIGVSAPLDVKIVRSELLEDSRKCEQLAQIQEVVE